MHYIDFTTTINYRDDNGGRFNLQSKTTTVEIDSSLYVQGVQNIGFAVHEAIDIGTITLDGGFARFRNLDDTNFVQIGLDDTGSFVPFVTLLPGQEAALSGLSDKDVYAKANTAAVDLEYFITDGPA